MYVVAGEEIPYDMVNPNPLQNAINEQRFNGFLLIGVLAAVFL